MYSINPLQSSYIQLNFDILTIGILNTNWDVKMNWKSPLQLFFNMYLPVNLYYSNPWIS